MLWGMSPKIYNTSQIDEQIINLIERKNINFLIIPFANKIINYKEEKDKINRRFADFVDFDINIDVLRINLCTWDKNYARRKIKNADIIRLPGGDPVLLKRRLSFLWIYRMVKDALMKEDGKIVVWNSAWTLIFFKYFISSVEKNKEYLYNYHSGFDLIRCLWVCHYTEWSREPFLRKYINELSINWVWIDEQAGYVITYINWKKFQEEVISIWSGEVFFIDK